MTRRFTLRKGVPTLGEMEEFINERWDEILEIIRTVDHPLEGCVDFIAEHFGVEDEKERGKILDLFLRIVSEDREKIREISDIVLERTVGKPSEEEEEPPALPYKPEGLIGGYRHHLFRRLILKELRKAIKSLSEI